MNVKRFDPIIDGSMSSQYASMEERNDGDYVSHDDYEDVIVDLKNVLELSWYITRTYATDDFNDDRTRSLAKLKELIDRYEV